jgi:predicted DNA-binding protein
MKTKNMKQITVTLPNQIAEALKNWAAQQGRPTANLAAFLVEQGIQQAQEKGGYSPKSSAKTKSIDV